MQYIKILMLETIASDAELVKKYLEDSELKFEITLATSNIELEKAFKEKQFDIVLADYSVFSLDTLLKAREKDKNLPFILVSRISEKSAINIVKNEGADDYILINHLDRLPTAIRQAMKHRKTKREKEECEISLTAYNS